MHKITRLTIALVVVLAAVAGAATPAAADDGGVLDALFGDDDDDDSDTGVLEKAKAIGAGAKAIGAGALDRAQASIETRLGGGELAGTSADRVEATWNDNTTVLLNWANNRMTASTELDVLKLRFEGAQDSEAVRYVIADVNETTGEYEAVGIVDSVEDMDLTVDEGCTLSDHAARNADAELAHFINEYAAQGENITDPYRAELKAEYFGTVDCTFSMTSGS